MNNVFAGDGKGLTNVDAARLGGRSPLTFGDRRRQRRHDFGRGIPRHHGQSAAGNPRSMAGGRYRLEPTRPTPDNHAGIVNGGRRAGELLRRAFMAR